MKALPSRRENLSTYKACNVEVLGYSATFAYMQARWLDFLEEYNPQIQSIPRQENIAGDALSKRPDYFVSKCLVMHNTISIMVCDIRTSHYLHDALQSLTIPATNTVQSYMGHSNQGYWEENTAIQQLVLPNAIVACTTIRMNLRFTNLFVNFTHKIHSWNHY